MTVVPQPLSRRILRPVGSVVAIWLLAQLLLTLLHGRPEALGGGAVYRPVLTTLSATRFLLLLAGTLAVYPIMYMRGSPLRERVAGALILPLVYAIWAMLQATAYFPAGEAIYYGFNPLTFGSVFLQVGLMGIAEIGCRWWRRRQGAQIAVARWTHVTAIVVGMAALYVTLLWDGGVHWFYVYQEGFKLLFQ